MSRLLTIRRATAYEYLMPLNRGFGTSRGVVNQARNLLLVLESEVSGSKLVGVGECATRSARLSGDTREGSWEFIEEVCGFLQGQSIPLDDAGASIDSVRGLMHSLRASAERFASSAFGPRPLRGTLSGIDMALLDLVARGHGVAVSTLLGKHRDHPEISAATISSVRDHTTIERKARAHSQRFPMNRIKAKGELETDLSTLLLVAEVNSNMGATKPLWMDANEGFDPGQAQQLVRRIAKEMRSRRLPPHVIIEQPVSKADGEHLARLQRLANRLLRRFARRAPWGRITIMADESLWDATDLDVIDGCGAINIKIQKVGGLLAALDLARAAIDRNPRTELYVGGMLGTSDITCWAMKNLAMAMPRLDYFTSVPPGNVEGRIAAPRAGYVSRAGNRLLEQEGPGLGTELSIPDLVPYVTRGVSAPPKETPLHGPAANRYGLEHLARFKKLALDSHLLELEALAHGLKTKRLTTLIFSASPETEEGEIAFYWTAANLTSRLGTYVAGNKQIGRRVLQQAGVAVPEGRQFNLFQREHAVAYAHELGWPLVVKPQAGTGGFGATTNIRSDSDLDWAIEAIKQTRHSDFVLERHIPGDKYRFLVVGDRVLSVVNTWPAHVFGDGEGTIAQLVLDKNLLRADNPHLRKRPIRPSERSTFQLQRQGLTWDSVPELGQRVALSTAENLNQGGDSVEVLDETHPSLLDMAVRAVGALPGLHHGGVDFLIEDRTRPLSEQSAGICEVNSIPASTMHHFPMIGPPRDVSGEMLSIYCDRLSIPLATRADELCVEIRVRGVVQNIGYRQWLRSLARDLGVRGWVRNAADRDLVEAVVAGPTTMVAAVASLAVSGPPKARPDLVTTRHRLGSWPDEGFSILPDAATVEATAE